MLTQLSSSCRQITDISHICDTLEELGRDLSKSLASIRANALKEPSKELKNSINDMTAILPTYIIAVFGKQLSSPANLINHVGSLSTQSTVSRSSSHLIVLA